MIRNSLLVIVLLLVTATCWGQNIPLGDRVYDLLDKAESRGYFHRSLPEFRPYSRIEIAKLLVELEEFDRSGDIIPRSLKAELHRQIEEYRTEITSLVNKNWFDELPGYQNRGRKFSRKYLGWILPEKTWRDDGTFYRLDFNENGWLTFDPTYVVQYNRYSKLNRLGDGTDNYEIEGDHDAFRRRWGFILETSPLPWLTACLHWRDVVEWGNDPYPYENRSKIFDDRIGYVNTNAEDNIAYEDLIGGILLHHGPISFLFGRDRIRWGPGKRSNLMLSGEGPSFSQARLDVDLGKTVRFTSVTGLLSQWPEIHDTLYTTDAGMLRTVRNSKYLAAHRLEVDIIPRLQLGLSEVVVYGERTLDFSYLNPVTVYFTEEHENGDQDNASLGIDFKAHPLDGVSIWGELMLDDFRFGEFGTDYWGNKTAILGGLQYSGTAGNIPIDIGTEYTRLEPFVYTHFYPINTYKHWNAPLGVQLKPNSDRTAFWINSWLSSSFRCGIEGYYLRHGDNSITDGNVGGNINIPHSETDPDEAPFLDGARTDRMFGLAWMDWELLEGIAFNLGIGNTIYIEEDTSELYLSAGIAWNMPFDRQWALRDR